MDIAANTLADELRRAFNSKDIFERCDLKPDPWQEELLACRYKKLAVCVTRQGGKSLCVCALAVQTAATRPDSTVIIICPTERLGKENLRRCLHLLRTAGYANEIIAETQTSLEFSNRSRIIALSAGRPDNLRGYSNVSLIIFDESAFIDDATFHAAMPFLATSGGVCVLLSTPNGARGFFYRTFTDEENGWHKIKIPVSMISRIPEEFTEAQKRELGPTIFAQEYECSFTDNGAKLVESTFFLGKSKSLGVFQ